MSGTEITSWQQSPGALMRNRGLVASPAAEAAEKARVAAEEKRQQRVAYEAQMDAADARLQAEGRLGTSWRDARKVQEALVAQGWTGDWIWVGSSVPPEMEALYAAAALAETSMQVTDASGRVTWSGPPELRQRMAEAAEERALYARWADEHARMCMGQFYGEVR